MARITLSARHAETPTMQKSDFDRVWRTVGAVMPTAWAGSLPETIFFRIW